MYTSLAPLALLLSSSALVASALPQEKGPWGSYNGNGNEQHGNNNKAPCSANVIALATGIHLNIQGQYGEYNATAAIAQIEAASNPVNQTAFYIAKGMLLADIQEGMNLREFNQQIAPAGNAALPGLAKYQAAQRTEAALGMGLTGVPSQDKAALESLKMDILQGIQLNEMNLKNATQDCDFTLVFPPANEKASP